MDDLMATPLIEHRKLRAKDMLRGALVYLAEYLRQLSEEERTRLAGVKAEFEDDGLNIRITVIEREGVTQSEDVQKLREARQAAKEWAHGQVP